MSGPTLVEKQDAAGIKYIVHVVGDRDYPDFQPWHDKDYGVFLEAIRNLEVRTGDTFTTGYPKSGNNWMYIISMVSAQATDLVATGLGEHFLDWKSLEELAAYKDAPDPRRLYTHLNPDSLPIQIPQKGCKFIFLLRNIKDVCVSLFHFCHSLKELLPYKGTWENFFDIFFDKRGLIYGTWFDHVKQADIFHKQHPEVPFHVLCFEQMKLTPVAEIQKLCKFLDVPDTLAEEIAEKVHFKKMKPVATEGKLKELIGAICESGTAGLFRKGEIGDWKNHFTVAQSEMVDKIFQEELGDSPIGQLVKPFM